MNMMLIKYWRKRDPVAGLIMRKQRSEMMVLEQDRKSAYIDHISGNDNRLITANRKLRLCPCMEFRARWVVFWLTLLADGL